VLDEDEFERNRVEMAYPDELVRLALAARDEVLRLGREGAFPFDYERQIADAGFGP
jgi:protein associated with RNAse G/E